MKEDYIEYEGKAIVLMLCSSCNIRHCKHCYISYKGDFDVNEAMRLSEKLSQKYKVLLNGAEVLCNPKYLDIYKAIGQKWILTNGYLIYNDDSIIDKLKDSGIDTIEMSYHFDMQNTLSVMNTDMLNKVIKKLKKYDFNIKLLTTVNSKDYCNIEDFCKIANELGVDAIKFINFISSGNASNMDKKNMLSKEQISEFFNILYQTREKYDKDVLNIQRSGTFGNDENHHCNFECPGGTDLVTITPDGNVYPCIFLAKRGNEIGYLEDDKIYIDKRIDFNKEKCLTLSNINKI